MPIKMVATRRFYLDTERRDVEANAEFSVRSEIEADKLERRKRAVRKPVETKAERPARVDIPKPVEKAVEPAQSPLPESGHYQRRDMRAEDGRTGEATSAPSSRRGRPPKAKTSND